MSNYAKRSIFINGFCRPKHMTERNAIEGSPLSGSSSAVAQLDLLDESVPDSTVKKTVVASVLAALSIAVAPSATVLARASFGIAIFDPVSLFWIAAFLIGGYRVGFISICAGTFGLFLYDPTGVGPFFKFAATLPMIVVPYLFTKWQHGELDGMFLSRGRVYLAAMTLAFVVRLVMMLAINIVIVPLLYPGVTLDYIIYLTVVLNLFQGFWDATIPYIVVFRTPIYKHFGLW